MTPAGTAVVDAAKADGSWTLLDDVEDLIVPADLAEAFAERDGAAETWEGFPRSVKRQTLEWIVMAKRPETRAKRIAETAGGEGRAPEVAGRARGRPARGPASPTTRHRRRS